MYSKLFIFFAILCTGIAIIYKIYFNDFSTQILIDNKKVNIFTKDELKKFNGVLNKELFLSILGDVYDVTEAEKYYGPGQSYYIFIGKDSSRSFITGDFLDENASDEVADLLPKDLLALNDWKKFYDKKYKKIGVLIGKYYDETGKKTNYYSIVQELIKNAEKRQDEAKNDEQIYPPCNIEWNADSGTRIWCTTLSGGINRNWVGVPRKYYKPGSLDYRCACVKNAEEKDPNLKLYENCDKFSTSCTVKN